MLAHELDAVDADVLFSLVADGTSEGLNLEFKRQLNWASPADTKELLADVTAMANAHGGDLIYGIEENDGVAAAVPGFLLESVDQTISGLLQKIRGGTDPRLEVRIKEVSLPDEKWAIIIRIPASLAAPHRVTFDKGSKFFIRTNREKHDMDVHELRQAFLYSNHLSGGLRQLHLDAIKAAKGHDMPFRIKTGATAVVSVMPMALLREERDIPFDRSNALAPYRAAGFSSLHMIEGVMMHSDINPASGEVNSYAISHRTGRADFAWTLQRPNWGDGEETLNKAVSMPMFEGGLWSSAYFGTERLKSFGVAGPWVIFATIYDIKGCWFKIDSFDGSSPAFRDEAFLGEIRTDRVGDDTVLPILKNFWLTYGVRRPNNLAVNHS